ncbi:GAF and ANTAR domain-containing protein [Nocardioides currus]|uniref:Transcription antitermination regulator n=1 Tax=Nocardioides currus TaxID=2133958 RepID=A0A2R7YUL2_9ACTN|nr:GAF and ANTAR domain-containing protein [Nocardioides currus]PUA80021.1 transcription antitermination regulator [Nocardioides currus]
MHEHDERTLEASRLLTDALTPGDLDQTLGRITQAAVDVLPDVRFASITVKHDDGRVETVAPTHETPVRLDAEQYALREGPCYDAATDSVHVIAPYLAEDTRFPRFAKAAVGVGIEAMAGLRLFESRNATGALNLYSERRGSFEDLDTLAALFTHQAGMAIGYARQVTQLKEAVATRQVIGQAVGITMERFGLDDARAFAFLNRLSQDSNTKLRDVAEQLVAESGERQGG